MPDGTTTVDPINWHLLKLQMSNPNDADDIYEVATLRPIDWVLQHDAFPGRTIVFETERSVTDKAYVVAVEKAPPIQPGPGRVVLSTYTHRDQILRISFTGIEEPLHTTTSHRIYSIDHDLWRLASDLRLGDRVRTRIGEARVKTLDHHAVDRVFDIEVETEHTYFVGAGNVLSHNCGGTGASYDKFGGQGVYVLIDPQTREVKYVGRGDAPARVAVHQRDFVKGRLEAHIIANNDLPRARARALEQRLMGAFGGAQSINQTTNIFNMIRSFSPMNKNATRYKQSLSPQQWREALLAVGDARRAR